MAGGVITLPWPNRLLHPNARPHWAAKARAVKAARQSAAWAVKAASWRVSPGLVPLIVTFHPPDRRRRDDDGMIASFKAARDGIADALGVDDSCFRPTYRFGEPVKGGAVIVELHEDADASQILITENQQ